MRGPSAVRQKRLIQYAQKNRSAMSDAEMWLWSRLRRQGLGVGFRRQHPIGDYIADFACVSLRLVVEVDGAQHFESPYDAERDLYMQRHGWFVHRVGAADVIRDFEGSVGTVAGIIESLQEPP